MDTRQPSAIHPGGLMERGNGRIFLRPRRGQSRRLVNSRRYFRQQRFDLCRYWEETGIRYLVDMFPLDGELEYMNDWYAPQSDLRSCSGRLETVWKGSTTGAWAPRAIRIGTGR